MKTTTKLTLSVLAVLWVFIGCGVQNEKITLISREDGSGTRGAFTELFGLLTQNGAVKEDTTSLQSEITNNTAVMMTSVAGDKNAIGYISLGSLNDTVKAVKIDGVEASAAAVASGAYKIARPFIIVTKGEIDAVSQDFIGFIMSADGQAIVARNGYVPIETGNKFESAFPNGKITEGISGRIIIAGSSSVAPVMEKLKEAYEKLTVNANIEIQQSDSSSGINALADGVCNIGMVSRELKKSEIEKGIDGTIIALDGIAVIVNKSNKIDSLTKEEVRAIFSGKINLWTALSK